jgi:hypothetical protein
MLSFRVRESEAAEVQSWADQLGVDRSKLLSDAIQRHLARLAAQADAQGADRISSRPRLQSLADTEVAARGATEDGWP